MSSISDPSKRGVLKQLRRKSDPQARLRMHRESTNLATLADSGVKVPHVLDGNTAEYENAGVELFFVMEHIPGHTLEKEVKARGRLPLEKAIAFALDLCRTVTAAHKVPILHRDLKPGNIIVRDFGPADLVIVDYGLSFNREDDGDDSATETGEQLRNKFLTLGEMSVLGGNQRDPRSDVTALCAIFYFCLTGHAPGMLHDGRGRPPHRREGYSVREAMEGSPHLQQVEAFLDKGFATDVEDRFQSAEESVERLQRLTAVPESSSFDLRQLSKEQGERVRRHRREVRLAEYSAHLQPLPHQLLSSMSALSQRLSAPFSLTIGAGNPFQGEAVQGGALLPSVAGITLLVRVTGFPLARGVIFAFGAEGEQVAFMQRLAWHEGGRWTREGTWEKVLWFDPNQPPSPDGFTRWMEGALAKVIRELADRACSG